MRCHPLVWIHRAEASGIVAELRTTGRDVDIDVFDEAGVPSSAMVLLRLSDPLMLLATRVLTSSGVAYRGPDPLALARCYDKWSAYQTLAANGIDCPETRLTDEADAVPRPLVVKPRRGSDSLGIRIVRAGALPSRLRKRHLLVQQQIFGSELTVGVIDGVAGMPLRLILPEGAAYTFARKYLLRPRREL